MLDGIFLPWVQKFSIGDNVSEFIHILTLNSIWIYHFTVHLNAPYPSNLISDDEQSKGGSAFEESSLDTFALGPWEHEIHIWNIT